MGNKNTLPISNTPHGWLEVECQDTTHVRHKKSHKCAERAKQEQKEEKGDPKQHRRKSQIESHESHKFEDVYQEGEELGIGGFGVVFIGKRKQNGKRYAVKKIDRSKMRWSDKDKLEHEISCLELVRDGPHIVKMYEKYCTEHHCFLVMEWMQGGDLCDFIIKKQTFSEKESRDVITCLLKALHYMHSNRIVHRDLKPENLLLTSEGSAASIKISDFTFARKVVHPNGCRTVCGTPGYIAPEILERWPAYDMKCDLWSVGVILFLLLGGYLPFEDDDEAKVHHNTLNGLYQFHPDYFSHVSVDAKELVTMLLTVNPNKRSNVSQAIAHKWMEHDDQHLQEKQINADKLKATTLLAKAKLRKAVNVIKIANRLKDFDQPTNWTSASGAPDPVQLVQDSETGRPFSYFYEIGRKLGEGGFAIVHQVKNKASQRLYAVKEIKVAVLDKRTRLTIQDEISALKLLRGGPHIIQLHDVFQERTRIFMVMEEMKGGDLLQRIVEKQVYTEREARQTCKTIFAAIGYIHNKQIAHRDLKPENILLVNKEDDTSVKIADFGFAKRVTTKNCLRTLCGTEAYVAPEVLRSKGYDERVDMWSIGVVLYILLGGYAPFDEPAGKLAAAIMRGKYEFHYDCWSHISSEAKSLIGSLLDVNPKSRWSAEEALESNWMTADAEILSVTDLSAAQNQIRQSLPLEKLRGAVKAIIAADKFQSLGESFTSPLAKDSNSRRHSRMLALAEPLAPAEESHALDMLDGSTTGKQFSELYDVGGRLGSADLYNIQVVKHKQSDNEYAVKSVQRKRLQPGSAIALQDEIKALKLLKGCESIIALHDVFEEPDSTFLVFECNMREGFLIDRVLKKTCYAEDDARTLYRNLLKGVQHCHERRIANRNLKLENILLVSKASDTDVKISDFGYAKKVVHPNSLRTQCGTEGYVAPEIIAHHPAYDTKCDMWSLGVMLYIMVGGYRPFRGTRDDIMRKIRYGEYKFDEKYWSPISENAKELIRAMLTVDPAVRVDAEDALRALQRETGKTYD